MIESRSSNRFVYIIVHGCRTKAIVMKISVNDISEVETESFSFGRSVSALVFPDLIQDGIDLAHVRIIREYHRQRSIAVFRRHLYDSPRVDCDIAKF